MTSLLSEIKAETQQSKKGKFMLILESMSEEDRKDLDKALKDESISTSIIYKVLKRRGLQFHVDRLYDYRRMLLDGSR